MKLKLNYADGSTVYTYTCDDATLQYAVDLLKDPNVIYIAVTKQTPTQYLKTQRALNERESKE